jgi:hypothetical protein
MPESPHNGDRDLACGAVQIFTVRPATGSIRKAAHECNVVDGHSGQHKCSCGYQWGARSDGN